VTPTVPASGGAAIALDDERGPAGTERSRLEGIDGTGSDLSRLLSLSDGVFAFALTFLAVSLLLPQLSTGTPSASLPSYLGRLEPAFLGYILSFFVIATWWFSHQRLFSGLVRYDPVIVRLNSFFLLVISVTPFLVELLFVYSANGFAPGSISARLAVAMYALAQAAGGAVLLGIWRHASRGRHLIRASIPAAWVRVTENNQWFTVVVFVS
jgi:uncharacterized membrane protein